MERQEGSEASVAEAADARGFLSDLFAASQEHAVLVVFLRQLGCSFAREMLARLAGERESLESDGTEIVLIHMSSPEEAAPVFARYGLHDVCAFSDPEAVTYKRFKLGHAGWRQLFHPRALLRAFIRGIAFRHGIGLAGGDCMQMPGVFVLREGKVASQFVHRHVGEAVFFESLLKRIKFDDELGPPGCCAVRKIGDNGGSSCSR